MSEDSPTYGNSSDVDLVPQMVTSWEVIKKRMEDLQRFVKEVMRVGQHYGPPYPGSDKLMLYKAGAELLAEIYGYTVIPRIAQRIEHWTPAQGGPFFQYEFETDVISKRTGLVVGKGFGSCNSMENRYRWRTGSRTCPNCNGDALIKSRFGPAGWHCYAKKGGCGENFSFEDTRITEQEVGRVENDDVCTLVNTILQVAKKRCFVAAVIAVTQSSGLFESGEDDDGRDGDGAGDEQSGPRSGGNRGGGRRGHSGAPRSAAPSNGNGAAKGGDKPPDDKHPTKVVIRGETHWTAGVEFKALMRVWELAKAYDKHHGKDAHKKAMNDLVGVEYSRDLNAEMAEKVIAALQAEVDRVGDGPPNPDAPPYDESARS